jgi:hypothetical protein
VIKSFGELTVYQKAFEEIGKMLGSMISAREKLPYTDRKAASQ